MDWFIALLSQPLMQRFFRALFAPHKSTRMVKPLPVVQQALFTAAVLALNLPPAIAHEVDIRGDVAGIWHIEPNHNPKVGVPARTWVALTRRGGQQIPLSRANCQMAVYSKPRSTNASPILRPPLRPISAERYQGIPGTDITFPKTGLYELELNCRPRTAGDFQPFQMRYSVTVTR